MMELLVAILIAIGSLTSPADYNDEFIDRNQDQIEKAQNIIDTGRYRIDERDGGVIVDGVTI